LILAAFISIAAANVALAQATGNSSPEEGATCPPDIKGEPPTVGGGSSAPLSDKLARSKGVIWLIGSRRKAVALFSEI
jgi:hypothetical protein